MNHSSDRKYILWDMDGTLIDSEPQHYRAWMRTFKRLYGNDDIPWEKWKTIVGARRDFFKKYMMDEFGVDTADPEVKRVHDEECAAVLREEGEAPMPGVKETLELLSGRGYIHAVASSSPMPEIEERMTGIGCRDCFTLLFTGNAVKNGKPAPDTFLACAKKLGAEPSECIVVEDSRNGTLAGHAAGMFCIGLYNPHSGDQDLSAADVIVNSLEVIPGLLQEEQK